jgi:uncharacterized OsmC-like protein
METMTKTMNGFQLEEISAVVSAIQANPKVGDFELRATNKWITGGHNRSYVQGFYGACQEDTSREVPFVYEIDEPPVLLGKNKGANPAEVILHGLLGCMTTTMVLLAAANGIEVKAVRSSVEGDIDLKGFLGLDSEVPKEFSQIRIKFEIDGATEDEKHTLIMLAKQSPVFNALINPVDVQVTI